MLKKNGLSQTQFKAISPDAGKGGGIEGDGDKAGNDAGMMNQISKDDLWME